MGQSANSGRGADLDDKKLRAAGRVEQNPQLNPALDPNDDIPAKGETGGAFGKDGHAHRNQTGQPASGAGGGGEANMETKS